MKSKYAGLGLVLISGVLFFAAQGLPVKPSEFGSSPKTIPVLATSIMLLFSIVYLFLDRTQKGDISVTTPSVIKMCSIVAAVIIYAFVLETLGYIVSTALLLLAVAITIEYKNPVKAALVSIIASVTIWLLFTQLFSAYLPRGELL